MVDIIQTEIISLVRNLHFFYLQLQLICLTITIWYFSVVVLSTGLELIHDVGVFVLFALNYRLHVIKCLSVITRLFYFPSLKLICYFQVDLYNLGLQICIVFVKPLVLYSKWLNFWFIHITIHVFSVRINWCSLGIFN